MGADNQATQRWWRQPLVHFVLAALAIFMIDAMRSTPPEQGSRRIVVTVAQVERLAGLWQKTWGRAPNEAELQSLVRDHIREEVYYREALNLGLDVNDTIIRRRLRQKMEFLSTSNSANAAPQPAQLQAYFERNLERYRQSARYDFEQIYFAAANRQAALSALAQLTAGAVSQGIGEPIGLPERMSYADESTVARSFGARFFTQLEALQPGVWAGPLTSGLGLHLVRVERREAAHTPKLEQVRRHVVNDWMAEQSNAALEAAYQQLRSAYEVEI